MIPTNETFETCSQSSVTIVLPKLCGLVDRPITITQVGTLRVAKVNPDTFSGAASEASSNIKLELERKG